MPKIMTEVQANVSSGKSTDGEYMQALTKFVLPAPLHQQP